MKTTLAQKFYLTAIFLTLSVGAVACAAVLNGCGWGATACQVIDAAQAACAVVKYMGPDGKEHTVRVSRDELQELAVAAAARQSAARDAGR